MGSEAHSDQFLPLPEARARVADLRRKILNRKINAVIIGAGRSGVAAAGLLDRLNCSYRVLDDRVDLGDGPIAKKEIDTADIVILSPGVPRARTEFEGVIRSGTLVSEIELASWFVQVPMVGITGTNGKSTTTALVAHVLESAQKRVFAGGNLGRPLSELALSEDEVDVAVVELSSFQLESIVEATFHVACWLNLTPDHGDRYPDELTYAAAKRRLLERRSVSGIAVLNAKDHHCAQAGLRLGGPIRWFAADEHSDLAGPMGTVAWLDEAIRTEEGQREVYRLDNPALPGIHNRANIAAAIECARHVDGVRPEQIQHGIGSFSGLAHRLERIPTNDGVAWYNDSKATNVKAAVTGVVGIDGPKILIMGGLDKGGSWAPLVEAAQGGEVKAVLAIGAAESMVKAAFTGFHVERVGTLERAVARARILAVPGDSVLLSPACASFDQFRNFEERGDRFRSLVGGAE